MCSYTIYRNTVQFSFNRDAEQCWAGTHFTQLRIHVAQLCVAERVGSDKSTSLNGIEDNQPARLAQDLMLRLSGFKIINDKCDFVDFVRFNRKLQATRIVGSIFGTNIMTVRVLNRS